MSHEKGPTDEGQEHVKQPNYTEEIQNGNFENFLKLVDVGYHYGASIEEKLEAIREFKDDNEKLEEILHAVIAVTGAIPRHVERNKSSFISHLIDEWNPDTSNLLSFAVLANRSIIAADLIEKGVPINHINSDGKTPLQHSIELGFDTISKNLINGRADLFKADSEGKSPLDHILEKNKYALATYAVNSIHKYDTKSLKKALAIANKYENDSAKSFKEAILKKAPRLDTVKASSHAKEWIKKSITITDETRALRAVNVDVKKFVDHLKRQESDSPEMKSAKEFIREKLDADDSLARGVTQKFIDAINDFEHKGELRQVLKDGVEAIRDISQPRNSPSTTVKILSKLAQAWDVACDRNNDMDRIRDNDQKPRNNI